jgi:hypothetical protein
MGREANTARRAVMAGTLSANVTWIATRKGTSVVNAASQELKLATSASEQIIDVETNGIAGWTVVAGQWTVEDVASAPSGKRALVQRATRNPYNVIVAPAGPYTDVDVSVRFSPMSGREDASGGTVRRFDDGRDYVARANALEDNFRLYSYDRSRRQLASATVKKPPLRQWHLLRIVAIGDRIQGWLNGTLLLDHRDTRFTSGRVGLWTKADSVTAFDDLTIRGVSS